MRVCVCVCMYLSNAHVNVSSEVNIMLESIVSSACNRVFNSVVDRGIEGWCACYPRQAPVVVAVSEAAAVWASEHLTGEIPIIKRFAQT